MSPSGQCVSQEFAISFDMAPCRMTGRARHGPPPFQIFRRVIKNFSLKFIDIMIGIILGLGFQWWTAFQEPWQYVAFVFAYFDIVDYWIDYAPSLKKFPPKREADIFLDLGIMFLLFLYIYSAQLTIIYFLGSFIIFRLLDFAWLLNALHEYQPKGTDRAFITTWLEFNLLEAILAGLIIGAGFVFGLAPLSQIVIYIIARILIRIVASLRYRRFYFA